MTPEQQRLLKEAWEYEQAYARDMGTVLTYDIDLNAPSITCKICGCTSFNVEDVARHYCGRCHVFHDDLWPPGREMLIGHPELVQPGMSFLKK